MEKIIKELNEWMDTYTEDDFKFSYNDENFAIARYQSNYYLHIDIKDYNRYLDRVTLEHLEEWMDDVKEELKDTIDL